MLPPSYNSLFNKDSTADNKKGFDLVKPILKKVPGYNQDAVNQYNAIPKLHTGGKVKKTGLYILKKNEFVLPTNASPTKNQKAKVNNNIKNKKSKILSA
jgi:hypothetical protein